MLNLVESDFINVKKYLEDAPSFVYSVLDKIIPGFVYVDSIYNNTFLIGTNSGLFYVIGDEKNNHFNDVLLELYRSKVNERTRFTLFSASSKWDESIKHIFNSDGSKISRYNRYAFTFNRKSYKSKQIQLSKEFTLEKINETLINRSIEFGPNYYEEYWGSMSTFLKHGYGYIILHNDIVVSECISIFKSKQFAEIDIATNDEYRGKGLALVTAQAFIDQCIAKEIIPRWDCDVDNAASISIANKMGFENPKEYSIFTKTV